MAVALASCVSGGSGAVSDGCPTVELRHARNLTLKERTGWTEARLVNPWDTTTILQTIALVPRNADESKLEIPVEAILVRTPLEKSLVTTTVIIGLLEELGADDAIAGVADVPYIRSSRILEKIQKGEIVNCGAWMAPDIERIIKLNPDAIILSPFQDGGSYGHLTDLSIPIIYAADYMEDSPLGRAEWMKFYGLMFGVEETADSLFNIVESDYSHLAQLADSVSIEEGRPRVMIDTPYMGAWYAHGRGSANDTFIRDAGGFNPFTDTVDGTSVGLPPERYFMEAHDADVWIQRYASPLPLTLTQLKADNQLYTRFQPFQNGNVWGCNTLETSFFEETPFHPEYLLGDLVGILHPGHDTPPLRYFKQVPYK